MKIEQSEARADLETLERSRATFALAVREGTAPPRDLERIEQQIADMRRQQERDALADREATARAQRQATEEARTRREALQQELDHALGQRQELARAVDLAADGLVVALDALLACGRKTYEVAAELNGTASARLMLRDVAHSYLQHRLSSLLPGMGRAERFARRRLSEILDGTEPERA